MLGVNLKPPFVLGYLFVFPLVCKPCRDLPMDTSKVSRPSGDNVDVVYVTLFCCYVANPYIEVSGNTLKVVYQALYLKMLFRNLFPR